LLSLLPQPGESVGGYRILSPVGKGGFGTVFKAERDGQLFALKVLRQGGLHARARREIATLLLLRHPSVVGFVGTDWWQQAGTGFLVIVMEWVEGVPLDVWASRFNPSALDVVAKVLLVARTLRDAHYAGVLHRDVKLDNLLLRLKDGVPVVVDWGLGVYPGAPSHTEPGRMPPGTPEYRSPQIVRYPFDSDWGSDPYEPSQGDEQWALGVVLYWLLTDWLPFGSREVGGLYQRIEHEPPLAPVLRNPRVPEELSALCLRMLEKEPGARFESDVALCAALEEAQARGRGEASWQVPLVDPERVEPMGRVAPWDAEEVEKRRQVGKPRRGGDAEARPAPPREALPPSEELPPARVPGVLWRLSSRGWLLVGGLLVGVLCVALSLVSFPPGGLSQETVMGQARLFREVAPLGAASHAGRGAAPLTATTPAPVVKRTTPRKEDARLKTQENTPPRRKVATLAKAVVAGAACTALVGCTAAAPQVRRVPPPQPCPPGAEEAMRHLGLYEPLELRKKRRPPDPAWPVDLPRNSRTERVLPVQDGPITFLVSEDWGELPSNTVLTGLLYIGPERVYGRLIQAQVPSGAIYPVCLELTDTGRTGRSGTDISPSSSDSVIKISVFQAVRPVKRFP
jgi:serine/threonine-protein kinase